MKPQELRIGNLVTDNFGISVYTVDSINSKGINLFVEDDGNWSELAKTWVGAEYSFDDIKPISLSEEWLLKLGFVKNNGKHGEYYSHNVFIRFVIWVDHEGLFVCGRDEVKGCTAVVESKYVHQLQNLYYALTGEELEVKA